MLSRINLAPMRFRRACAPDGPIAKIAWTTVGLYGTTVVQANAWLKPGLRPQRGAGLYSDADGTGSAPTAAVARHKAISEALERWAYDSCYRNRSTDNGRYGFELDPTSAGLAAFPGLFATTARRAALEEATERACLIAWSAGRVRSRLRATDWPAINAVEIESPAGGVCVILFRRNESGFYAYGHAAADTFAAATQRALIELGRNELVLGQAYDPGVGRVTARTANLVERRCVYFSTPEGHETFLSRIGVCPAQAWEPELAVDTEVIGPWSTYATVWRALYRPPLEGALRDLDLFV